MERTHPPYRTARPRLAAAATLPGAFAAALLLGGCGSGSDSVTADGEAGPAAVLTRGVLGDDGRVTVSGRALDTSAVRVGIDGELGSLGELSAGMRVTVLSRDGEALWIDYDEDVEGPLDARLDDDTLSVMGQRVRLVATTVLDGGAGGAVSGDVLEISGARRADDSIEASYVEREDDLSDAYEVRGPLRDLDPAANTFRIGELTVDYSTARFDDLSVDALREGLWLEVKDRTRAYEPGSLYLRASDIEPDDGHGGALAGEERERVGDEYEIEGYVTRVIDETRFEIAGTVVRFDAATRFRDGERTSLAADVHVEVEGALDAAGELLAWDIEFSDADDRERHDAEPARGHNHHHRPGRHDEDGDGDDDGDEGRSERDEEDSRVEIEGVVQAVDATAGTLSVGGIVIRPSTGTEYEDVADRPLSREAFFARLVVGATVVKATWRPFVDYDRPPHELEIED